MKQPRCALRFTFARRFAGTLAVASAFALGPGGCQKPPPPPPPQSPTVARVDGAPILLSSVQREVDKLRRGEAGAQDTSSSPLELGHAVLGPLVDRQILLARAKALGLTVSEADVQRATDALADDARKVGVNFGEHLAQDDETAAALHEETRDRLLAERAMSSEAKFAQPTPAEIKAYGDEHKNELALPEQVHAAQILVRTPEEAKSILDQLRAGAAFDALARAHSLSPDAKAGGDLGFFPRGVMPPPFDQICFSLRTGQVSGIVRSSYGYHLFKLIERRSPHHKPLEEMAPVFAARIARERRAEAERTLLASLRAKAQISIDEPALSQVH